MKTFYLPDLGEGLAEAEIRDWYVKEGDVVKVDQPLLMMETAKAVVDVPSPLAGKIVKLHGNKGDIIPTGSLLVEFEGEAGHAIKDKGTVVGNLEESAKVLNEQDVIIGAVKQTTSHVKAMPAVRALAKQLNVDLNALKATGPQGQITIDDVKNAAGGTKPLFENGEALHGVRRVMAVTMAQAHHEIASVTLMDDADITDLGAQSDLTVCLLQAMIAALQTEPALNAWYDGKSLEIYQHRDVHLGVAVDTAEGLFVPVIKNADKKNAKELRAAIDVLKKSVQDRSISPSELQGATMTLSNFGMFAGRYANPMIVPPQVAILGCGRVRDEARVHEGKIVVRRIMPLSLTFDHRAVTGGEASRYLGAIIKFLEKT